MSMQDVLKRIARENELDTRVATVQSDRSEINVVNGQWVKRHVGVVEMHSEHYAVSFVRKYSWDEQQIKRIFGGAYDIEDLQYEMLTTMYKAARKFVENGGEGNWKAYLSHSLKTRLWDLSTKDPRRKNNVKYVYLWDEAEYTQAHYDETHDLYTGDVHAEYMPNSLIVEDVYQHINDLNQVRVFLEDLTVRQRKIILLRWEHVPGDKENDGASNKDIAQQLGICEKTLNNELLRIQRAFREYAEAHHEADWMAYLKKLQRK